MRITNEEMVNAFLKGKGLHKEKKDDSVGLIIPYLLLDASYQHFGKTIRKVDARFKANKIKNDLIEEFSKQNKSFFRCFEDDITDAVIDKMDSLEEYISNSMEILRLSILGDCKCKDEHKNKILSDILLCIALLRFGSSTYSELYKKATRTVYMGIANNTYFSITGAQEEGLERLLFLLEQFSLHYCGVNPNTMTSTQGGKINEAMRALCNKIITWMKNDKQNEKSRNESKN